MRLWHRHRPDPEWTYTLGRVFRHELCRCGLHRITWLEKGLPWWQSTWAEQWDVDRQLSRAASEAPARLP